jgi:hypothetical protein
MTDADLDARALAILKELHNHGAGLYNTGDPAGAWRLYEATLRCCRPFLPHRPAVQRRIADGLAEVDRTDGVRVKAFRLHELIDEVRTDLKAFRRPGPGAEPPPPSGSLTQLNLPADFPAAVGTVRLATVPLGGVHLTAHGAATASCLADAAGRFRLPGPLPAGEYTVTVAGRGVPPRYAAADTSPLRLTVTGGMVAAELVLAPI